MHRFLKRQTKPKTEMNRDGVRNGCKVVNYIAYHDPALVNGAGMMKRMMKGRGEKLKCGGRGCSKCPPFHQSDYWGYLAAFILK